MPADGGLVGVGGIALGADEAVGMEMLVGIAMLVAIGAEVGTWIPGWVGTRVACPGVSAVGLATAQAETNIARTKSGRIRLRMDAIRISF
jgi:hypothetical protein